MNHTQKKYAQDRVAQLAREHRARIETDVRSKRLPDFTADVKLRMIRDGEAVFHPERAYPRDSRYREVPDLLEMFDYPGEEETARHNAEVAAEVERRVGEMHAAAADLKDDLVLGDAVLALDNIRAFAAREF